MIKIPHNISLFNICVANLQCWNSVVRWGGRVVKNKLFKYL